MELVEIINNEAVTTSKQVAEVFGKRHGDVIRSVENILYNSSTQNCVQWFSEDLYKDISGKMNRQFIMNRDGFTLLAMGFTGSKALEFKMKYIEAFNEMEARLKDDKLNRFASLPFSEQMLAVMNAQSQEMNQMRDDIDDVSDRVHKFEENARVDSSQIASIQKAVKSKVYEVISVRNWCKEDKTITGKMFSALNGDINRAFNVNQRGMLKSKDYNHIMSFINDWQPDAVTVLKNNQRMSQLALEI